MTDQISDKISGKIDEVSGLYYRLILLAGPAGSGKTTILQQVQDKLEIPLVNLNLELSQRMLDLTLRQRVLHLNDLLREILKAANSNIALLDNIEILFDILLKHDPIKLMKSLSRDSTLVISWNGLVENGFLTYASQEHKEYRRYPAQDLIILSLEENS